MSTGLIISEIHDNERLKKVIIDWSKPRSLDKNWYDEILSGRGLYYLSRKFGKKDTLLYIGQTFDCFYNRFVAHDWYWLNKYRGEKRFRLGSITYPTGKTDVEMNQLIKDVESVLIYTMKPKENIMGIYSYTPKHLYVVSNTEYLGELPKTISMRDHIPL